MVRVLAALHAHHISTEIGQQARTKRAGEHVSEIQDSDSC
jgi:hypothetical protein